MTSSLRLIGPEASYARAVDLMWPQIAITYFRVIPVDFGLAHMPITSNTLTRAPIFLYAYDAYILAVKYSFDPTKNAANLRKHGVSLADGDGVLSDPLALTVEDDATEGEARWVTIGTNYLGAAMVVVWSVEGEEIRIVSVRKPDPKERRAYEEGV